MKGKNRFTIAHPKKWHKIVICVFCLLISFASGFGIGRINTVKESTFYELGDYCESLLSKNKQYEEQLSKYETTEAPTPLKTVNTVSPEINELSYNFIDVNEFSDYLTDGIYRCGSDFEQGDYYIISLYGAAPQYKVLDNPNDFVYSYQKIIYKLSPKTGQYVNIPHGAILVPVSSIDENNWNKYGVFLVGKDLPAGEYKLERITDTYNSPLYSIGSISGAYQISNNHPADSSSDCNGYVENQTYIALKNGQYLTINNIHLTLVE